MSQQITIQPPHDEKGGLEYRKGGHFRTSLGVTLGLLVVALLIFFAIWLIWDVIL